jgi:hypothetical protein
VEEAAVSLIVVGSVVGGIALPLVVASFVWERRRVVLDKKDSTALSERSGAHGRPYRGIIVPLHYPMTALSVEFAEESGRQVRADVRDFITQYGGNHMILNYGEMTAASGVLRTQLKAGTYDIHFSSTDDQDRKVSFRLTGVERTLHLEKYREVALATVTIGIVLLAQGIALAAT